MTKTITLACGNSGDKSDALNKSISKLTLALEILNKENRDE